MQGWTPASCRRLSAAQLNGGIRMPYVYHDADALEGTEKVGDKHCVALVRHYAGIASTSHWTKGDKVLGHVQLAKGTAIATFVDGRYPNQSGGNHATFYLRQDLGGIWIMDQWSSDVTKPKVSSRYIRKRGGVRSDGTYPDASNNAEAFSVIR